MVGARTALVTTKGMQCSRGEADKRSQKVRAFHSRMKRKKIRTNCVVVDDTLGLGCCGRHGGGARGASEKVAEEGNVGRLSDPL